jgi:beta-glucanase (GH16 family)
MKIFLTALVLLTCSITFLKTQTSTVEDDFEGNGTISSWFGDDCNINTDLNNPFQQGINTSEKVLEYHDTGGQYANVRFELTTNFELTSNNTFTLKVYLASNGLSGSQSNQVSLKLQDGTLNEPWSTQSEITKTVSLDQWQTVTFDFENDPYLNLDGNSPPPTQRSDFNRVVIQLNGENNDDQVLAYLDDFRYDGTVIVDPTYDNLVWSDEFEVNGPINSVNWFHQTQLPQGGNWYNGEVQHYTDRTDNSYVENGVLKIVAKKETFTDQDYTKAYTSARLNSKFAFTYGKVEIRAKMPTGIGTWPAIWMLGKNINEDGAYWENEGFGTTTWPACGEIDIMEHWGDNQNFVQSALHTPSSFGDTFNKGGQNIATVSSDFHTYTMVWTPEEIAFSVNGVVHYTYNPPIKNSDTWPFDADQYLLLNIAIQPSIFPSFSSSAMEVDYIRVYQESLSPVLPVALSHFSAKAEGRKTNLQWKTATETNSDYFQIEKLVDGSRFTSIGQVKSAGNSTSTQSYEMWDNAPATGINYYRLKQVDIDGTSSYSNTLTVSFDSDNSLTLVMWKALGQSIESTHYVANSGSYHLMVVDLTGRVVYVRKLELTEGLNEIAFDTPATGILMMTLSNKNQQLTTKVFKPN